MAVREQLIEILRKPIFPHELVDPTEAVADYLLDNGATIQRWIPVTERLPGDDIPSSTYLCWWSGHMRICKFWRTRRVFEFNGRVVNVTHWMPMPQAPGKEGA